MSTQDIRENKRREYQESFLGKCDEDDDILPHQLSGDESAERSILMSDVSSSKANFLLTVTTIMKTVIGAGILSLPYAVSKLGYVLAPIMLILVICLNQFSAVLLLKAKNLSKHSNYSSIAYHIFQNKIVQGFCSSVILINNLGICIAELCIFKAALVKIIHSFVTDPVARDAFYTSEYMMILVLALMEVPFTLVKKIEKLKFMAFLGVAGISVFLVCLIFIFFQEMGQQNWDPGFELRPFPESFLGAVSVVPVLFLALSYQMNFFPIYKGMKNSCDSKMQKASISGLCACGFFYIVVGLIGYTLYGFEEIDANFLLELNTNRIDEVLYVVINASFLISVFFSFPVMFFGARNNFIALIKMVILRKQKKEIRSQFNDNVEEISSYMQEGGREEKKKKAQFLFYVYTFILYLVVVGVALGVDDIEVVFNIVGAIASNSIGFILPCFFYHQLVQRKKKLKDLKLDNWKYYLSKALFFFLIPFGVFVIVAQLVKDE